MFTCAAEPFVYRAVGYSAPESEDRQDARAASTNVTSRAADNEHPQARPYNIYIYIYIY